MARVVAAGGAAATKCYIATCQRPTVVTHAVTCHFTAPTDLNLVVAKCTRLELYLIGPSGLTTVLDSNVYGQAHETPLLVRASYDV